MNDKIQSESIILAADLPAIGGAFKGGFFAGVIECGGTRFAIVVAPKADGDHDDVVWAKSVKRLEAARSFCDGLANTAAMAEAGSALAKWAQGLAIGDFKDWYIPSRDELELVYRTFKPSTDKNYVHRNGDNPSSVPAGYPYTATEPAQTAFEDFRTKGPEAMERAWYWTSTQCEDASSYAWVQTFAGGRQDYDLKDGDYRARAVRRVAIL